jgi:hypothetical protein
MPSDFFGIAFGLTGLPATWNAPRAILGVPLTGHG